MSKEQDLKGEEDYRLAKEEKDDTKAFALFQKAADKGFSNAQLELGRCFALGRGVIEDETKAFEWYSKASSQNNLDAELELGYCFESGKSVAKDVNKAFSMYQNMAMKNYPLAINRLGMCYDNGIGIQKDRTKAVQLFLQAAKLGDGAAQYNVAMCYKVMGGTQNDQKYFCWLQQAALNLSSDTQNAAKMDSWLKLGQCYEKGVGTSVNFVEAIRWYAKANNPKRLEGFFEDHAQEISSIMVSQQEKIDQLEKTIVELECRPGGPVFLQAKEEFEKLSLL